MCRDMDQQQHHSTREATSEVLDGNCDHRSLHDADRFRQNEAGDINKHSNRLSTDDNFSSNSSWHRHGDMSRNPSASSVDDRSIKSGDDSDGAGSTNGSKSSDTGISYLENNSIWIPPEAADKEHETESFSKSIAYDDDDDYSDGIKWGQSSFPSPGEEHEASANNARVEREKAMLEAMNGQLKILVSRFLASAGISSSKGEGSESWLDIVTSLSWEAALLIKPDASMGKEMDPGSYIKVKCIASGTRRQSEVIKGLVFKKNAAHKHMPTDCHNPRLLLLKGVLGHSDVGLSSFNSMDQEKDILERTIAKMMEICSPNVVMVEKTVSRNIQELLLKEGVTLILDMKLNRLKRIARCTGSPIVSFSEVLDKPNLKQCDYFHIEKFIEEHNSASEGGKMPSKTLMFLEGFPRPLGCTILLRGANSEKLKKVKQIMHFTVFAAYHLILETSFFEDQRVFLNDKNVPKENSFTAMEGPSATSYDVAAVGGAILGFPLHEDSPALRLYHATSNGYADVTKTLRSPGNADAPSSITSSSANELGEGANIRYDLRPPQNAERLTSPVPGPLRKLFADMLHHQNIYLPVTSLQETNDNQKAGKVESGQERVSDSFHVGAKVEESAVSSENGECTNDLQKQELTREIMPTGSSTCDKIEESPVVIENGEHRSTRIIIKDKYADKDQADDALDSHSILILMSSQCITKQVVCEQSHLSRIKYYGDFDVSLGRYLQDILQNQKLSCSLFGEPPEAQVYSYTHRNGNLTVLAKHLVPQHHLPGESEGKIWMWTRCLRCDEEHGISKSTPRVLISAEACNLSFGKFLELSFSSHSAARRLSICGHLVNRDCLRFFGLGSKVAMFRYSSVEIYTTCKPQPILQFFNPIRQDLFEGQRRHVHARGMTLFSEVASLLQHLKNEHPDAITLVVKCGLSLPVKDFPELEELLMKEKTNFEGSLGKAIDQNGRPFSSVHELLNLNWSYQDLLLELYVWDRRLHQLFNCKSVGLESVANCKNPADTVDEISDNNFDIDKKIGEFTYVETTTALGAARASDKLYLDHRLDKNAAPLLDESPEAGHSELSCNGGSKDEESSIAPGQIDVGSTTQTSKVPCFEISNDTELQGNAVVADPIPVEQEPSSTPQQFRYPYWDDRERWIWNSISESQLAYRNDIQAGYLDKFELINHYSPSYLSPLFEQNEEVVSPQFAVGPGSNVLCVLEDEISSIIARALAVSDERRHLMDSIVENGMENTRAEHAKIMEKSYSFLSESSFNSSSPWSSIGSLDSEANLSSLLSFPSDDFSGYDSSSLLSSVHPEMTVNGKVTLKGKYSVTSIYANQFYALRKKCCPSELAYITSLSRCKKWDAQGGKSKAFFAKTMDDRFIIKQIKKTEFESFIKFAPEYFKHVYHSLDTGSQTCLAKILGIYQVKQIRHGKEVKIDLMVMENLLFGHNISRIYDLKGAIFSRRVADSDDRDTVYLDQNFVEDMSVSPIYIGGKTKHLLQRAVWNDTSFLTSVNVMDYSLLVGVDKQKHELVFGIIDYLRQYTWDKQLETWVKTSLVVPKNASPTVISPREYKKRFRKFMAKYFLTVPDNWSPDNPSKPSKLVEAHSGDSLHQHPIEAEACA
ncbi:1-phosphatidylinositol-3-phosphate 5-kinase FAB1A-like [Phragmites australis]|uniref:1-phosphatidylinositol-3-phosphate 5-kinase FAB1A-like n=1 Tax=Phragmites australis TaxID=29695 RepID=UPI002D793C37|nr:1-phosphatidylinositol-3-phosphate 5-kinase FAB1A-like [Phragmites australis]XP_062191799.1 1-phosphatidylinositol-3-phosphate 5-kinase FAB1A-like [Phragmites australis]XP_062191800.1 1-phosphatidylinositol-3-phosphate 5-kinase FAB1A-like [Phragmites australis]